MQQGCRPAIRADVLRAMQAWMLFVLLTFWAPLVLVTWLWLR